MSDTNQPEDARSRVLIVEDHAETRYFLELALEDPYQTETASTGEEALTKAERDEFDLLIVDIALGESMTGVELVELLRERPAYAQTPMIAVTAHIFREGRDYYLQHGFDDYLRKPFFPEALLASIEKLLSQRPSEQQPRP
jgi:CheY-like chemotaxis protein